MNALEAALGYASRGWRVVPIWPPSGDGCACPKGDACKSPGKHPATDHGYKSAATEEAVVRRMFSGFSVPLGVGIATGPESDLLVLDVDARHRGLETLKTIFTDEQHRVPVTPVVATGGGGLHIYFRYPTNASKLVRDLAQGVEVKGTGFGVVAPPSRHASGEVYSWDKSEDRPPANVPEWLLERLTATTNLPRNRGRSYSDQAGRRSGARDEDATDLVNARLFVAEHGDSVRYAHDRRRWYWWTGKLWQLDEDGSVQRLAMETVNGLYERAVRATGKKREKLLGRAKSAESAAKIRAMLDLAGSIEPIAITSTAFDRDPYLLNVQNGTVELKAGKLRGHSSADLITRISPASFDPNATCPKFDKFLYDVMNGREDLIGFLRRVVGYCLTGDTSEHVLLIFWGTGANGKSTFVMAIEFLLAAYAVRCPVETLLLKRGGGGVPNDIARLRGARFIAAVEAQDGRRLDEALVKQLTGGDTISARFLYGEYFDFVPSGKLVVATNYKPYVQGTDEAIWRRLRLVPFEVTIPETDRDRYLLDKLKAEKDGVLAWAVRGCIEWQRTGLNPPREVVDATKTYRESEDRLAGFFRDECVLGPKHETPHGDLYRRCTIWADRNRERPMSSKAFSTALDVDTRIQKINRADRNKTTVRVGIGLVSVAPPGSES